MKTSRQPEKTVVEFWRIVRPTSRMWIEGQPLTDDPLIFTVHRIEKRTVPCDGESCLFCLRLFPTEERIYLPMNPKHERKREMLDLPVSHWNTIQRVVSTTLRLSGHMMRAERIRYSDNAPIKLRFRKLASTDNARLPLPRYDHLVSAIFEKNRRFAMQLVESVKKAAVQSSLMDDRH